MQNKTNIRIFTVLAFLLLTGFSNSLRAQTFEEARNFAFNGEREKARSICREILAEGFNSDVALLMGRTYAWDGKYDSARVVLQNVLVQRPGNMEAYDALSDVEFWADNNEKAIEYCDEALKI
jgi:tetratricopeptide (TPR) repeat protein